MQLPLTVSAGGTALLLAFVFLAMGENIDDISIATLARACAIFFFGVAALFLIRAPVSFAALLRMHRRLGGA